MLTMSRMTDHIIKHVLVESQRTWYESFSVESGNKKNYLYKSFSNKNLGAYTLHIFTTYICCIYQARSYIHIKYQEKYDGISIYKSKCQCLIYLQKIVRCMYHTCISYFEIGNQLLYLYFSKTSNQLLKLQLLEL